jgi:hypothetical protein
MISIKSNYLDHLSNLHFLSDRQTAHESILNPFHAILFFLLAVIRNLMDVPQRFIIKWPA